MKPIFFLLPALLAAYSAIAQQRMSIPRGCAFDTDVKNENPFVFDPDQQAQQIVAEICRAIGIPQKFQLKSADVKNALACEEGGQRFILYNTIFLKDFQSDARSKWAAYGVLAHEIGHHVSFHNFKEDDSARRKELELEADRFAGSVMRLLGATKDEARTAVSNLVNKTESATHPPATARLLAVVNGWNHQDERLRKIGVTGVNDPSGGSGGAPVVRDGDGDGIPDGQDACPDVPGETLLNGCPDADSDGIADDDDACPYQKGESRWQGCPDTDGDGIPNNKDKCPYVRGELENDGCPPPDRDRDGIPDKADRCPDQTGTVRFRGCADTDADGIPDPDDKCPNEKGDPAYGGCASPLLLGEGSGVGLNTAVEKLIKNQKSGLSLKTVQGGTFTMGSPANESGRGDDECQHSVTVTTFKIGIYEVTQADWRAVMGSDPPELYNKGCDDCPVENVSWNDIQDFLKKIETKTGQKFRLPMEEEWEYAARGGNQSKGYKYAGSNNLDDVAWYFGGYRTGNTFGAKKTTQPVGTKNANELGLYDMSGNVWEWCQNEWKAYPGCKADDCSGCRVLRGGSWINPDIYCRSVNRYPGSLGIWYGSYGFRLAQD